MKNTKLQEKVRLIQAEIPNGTKVPAPSCEVVKNVGNNQQNAKDNSKSMKDSGIKRQKV